MAFLERAERPVPEKNVKDLFLKDTLLLFCGKTKQKDNFLTENSNCLPPYPALWTSQLSINHYRIDCLFSFFSRK